MPPKEDSAKKAKKPLEKKSETKARSVSKSATKKSDVSKKEETKKKKQSSLSPDKDKAAKKKSSTATDGKDKKKKGTASKSKDKSEKSKSTDKKKSEKTTKKSKSKDKEKDKKKSSSKGKKTTEKKAKKSGIETDEEQKSAKIIKIENVLPEGNKKSEESKANLDERRLNIVQNAMVMDLLTKQLKEKDKQMQEMGQRLSKFNENQNIPQFDPRGANYQNDLNGSRRLQFDGGDINLQNQRQIQLSIHSATPKQSDRQKNADGVSINDSVSAIPSKSQGGATVKSRGLKSHTDKANRQEKDSETSNSIESGMQMKQLASDLGKVRKGKRHAQSSDNSSQDDGGYEDTPDGKKNKLKKQSQHNYKCGRQQSGLNPAELSDMSRTDRSEQQFDEPGDDVDHLKRQVAHLQLLNAELKKKIIKYKKQVEIIPELKAELQKMRSTIEVVQKGAMTGALDQFPMFNTQQYDDKNFTLLGPTSNQMQQIQQQKQFQYIQQSANSMIPLQQLQDQLQMRGTDLNANNQMLMDAMQQKQQINGQQYEGSQRIESGIQQQVSSGQFGNIQLPSSQYELPQLQTQYSRQQNPTATPQDRQSQALQQEFVTTNQQPVSRNLEYNGMLMQNGVSQNTPNQRQGQTAFNVDAIAKNQNQFSTYQGPNQQQVFTQSTQGQTQQTPQNIGSGPSQQNVQIQPSTTQNGYASTTQSVYTTQGLMQGNQVFQGSSKLQAQQQMMMPQQQQSSNAQLAGQYPSALSKQQDPFQQQAINSNTPYQNTRNGNTQLQLNQNNAGQLMVQKENGSLAQQPNNALYGQRNSSENDRLPSKQAVCFNQNANAVSTQNMTAPINLFEQPNQPYNQTSSSNPQFGNQGTIQTIQFENSLGTFVLPQNIGAQLQNDYDNRNIQVASQMNANRQGGSYQISGDDQNQFANGQLNSLNIPGSQPQYQNMNQGFNQQTKSQTVAQPNSVSQGNPQYSQPNAGPSNYGTNGNQVQFSGISGINNQQPQFSNGNYQSAAQMIANQRSSSPIDYSFGIKTGGQASSKNNPTLEQLRKQLDVKDEKTFAFVKENVELKSCISELKEQLIKKTHEIEKLNSEIKIMLNDMRYMHQKLNKGQQIQGMNEDQITSKFLVSQIDDLIDEKVIRNKDQSEKNQILEERIIGLKQQVNNLQSIIDKNQEILVQQQSKLASYEDQNHALKQDLNSRQESDKLLDHFKQHVRNQLVNMKLQIDAIQTNSGQKSIQNTPSRRIGNISERLNEMSLDSLFEQVAQCATISCQNEQNLRAMVEHLEKELKDKTVEFVQRNREQEERQQNIAREEAEIRMKLQDHIRRLEDHIEQQKYDKSFNIIDADARIKAKDMHVQQFKEDGEILESLLHETFMKFKTLNFEKQYLEMEVRSLNQSLDKVERELRRFVPQRNNFVNNQRRPIKVFKKAVRAMMFSYRLRKVSQFQPSETQNRHRALSRLLDNWLNNRKYWDSSIKQNARLFAFVENLNQRLSMKSTHYLGIPTTLLNEKRLEFVDALKVRMNDIESQVASYTTKMGELRSQVDLQDRRIRNYEQDQRMRSSLSGERELSASPIRQPAHVHQMLNQKKTSGQEELVQRLRIAVKDLESRLEEQQHTYDQKIRYLKQEIEMKRLQIENMKRLIDFRETAAGSGNSQEKVFSSTQPLSLAGNMGSGSFGGPIAQQFNSISDPLNKHRFSGEDFGGGIGSARLSGQFGGTIQYNEKRGRL